MEQAAPSTMMHLIYKTLTLTQSR